MPGGSGDRATSVALQVLQPLMSSVNRFGLRLTQSFGDRSMPASARRTVDGAVFNRQPIGADDEALRHRGRQSGLLVQTSGEPSGNCGNRSGVDGCDGCFD